MSKRKICPRCGSNHAVNIIYGLPSVEVLEDAEKGKFVMGGCCIPENAPTTFCKTCEYEWGGPFDHPLSSEIYMKAWIGGHFGPSKTFEADRLNGITYQYQDSMYEPFSIVEKLPITSEIWNQLIKGLVFCDFYYWLDDYKHNSILDGTQWQVEVRYEDDSIISKGGSNAFPGRWGYFCKMISKLTGHPFM